MIKIYHYSNKDFKGYVKPDFFGLNSYSGNSARLSDIKRVYFYRKPEIQEWYLIGSQYLYISKVNLKRIYNIDIDILELKNQGHDIYQEAKNRGYIGIYNHSQIILFKAVKIIKKIGLTK
jgi:hypothetical protein